MPSTVVHEAVQESIGGRFNDVPSGRLNDPFNEPSELVGNGTAESASRPSARPLIRHPAGHHFSCQSDPGADMGNRYHGLHFLAGFLGVTNGFFDLHDELDPLDFRAHCPVSAF